MSEPVRDADADDEERPGLLARLKARWAAVRAANPWLAHAIEAYQRQNNVRGSYFAAGITFFSFVSLFPVLLVVVSVLGYVLLGNHALEARILANIENRAPQGLAQIVQSLFTTAQNNAGSLGIAGLLSGIVTGLGWVANLREGCRAMWELPRLQLPFLKSKLADFAALGGLLLGIAVSVGASAALTGVTGVLVRAVGLDGVPGAGTVTFIIGVVVSVLANLLVMGWFLTRLPRVQVPRGVLVRGSFLAAIGFEILTLAGTQYIRHVNSGAAFGVFGSILGALVYVNLVARFLLYATAWTATGTQSEQAAAARARAVVEPDPAPVVVRPPSRAAVAGALVGAGAALGGLTVGVAGRLRRRRPAAFGTYGPVTPSGVVNSPEVG